MDMNIQTEEMNAETENPCYKVAVLPTMLHNFIIQNQPQQSGNNLSDFIFNLVCMLILLFDITLRRPVFVHYASVQTLDFYLK